jgi:hypothetical protein
MTLLDKGSGMTQDSEVLLMRRERQGSDAGAYFGGVERDFESAA